MLAPRILLCPLFLMHRFILSRVLPLVLSALVAGVIGMNVSASTPPHVPHVDRVAFPDTTAELSWASRLVRLHSALTQIGAQPEDENVPQWVAAAFEDAQVLAAREGMLGNANFREMYAEVHRLHESYHGVVAPIELSRSELTSLRVVPLAFLASLDPALLVGIDLRKPFSEPEPEVAEVPLAHAVLTVPTSEEHAVSTQQQRMMRQYGGLRGMRNVSRAYFPMIERALLRLGVPDEMKYVAVVESSLDPNAVSEDGATGLWQFMPATGAMYGLSEEDLRSPSRSTIAAARHLERLGRMFNGDWQLAAAAYNGGDGRVLNAVNRVRNRLGRTPTYWEVSPLLPAETRTYVAKFIATARVMGG